MKKILIIISAVMALASVSQAQRSVVAAIINHNVASGGQARAAANHIEFLLEMEPQKGLLLINEGNNARQYFNLPYSDWHHIWPATPHEGRGNPIFTRDAAATMLDSWKLEMTESWTHKKPKDPRVYTAVRCQLVANPWVEFYCVNVHFPTNRVPEDNAAARQETVDRLILESAKFPELPYIICGDFNMGENQVRNRIADPIGGRVHSVGVGVDHIVVRDGTQVGIGNIDIGNLGKFISDHNALRYNITFNELTTGVSDWTLY